MTTGKPSTSGNTNGCNAPGPDPGQCPLGAFSTWIHTRRGIYDAGYVTASVDHDTTTMTVLWAGTSPLLDEVRTEAAARGIQLVIRPVRYSKPELTAGAHRLFAARTEIAEMGFLLHAVVGTNMDRDGLLIEGQFTSTVPETLVAQRLAEVLEAAKAITPGVVDARVAEPPMPA